MPLAPLIFVIKLLTCLSEPITEVTGERLGVVGWLGRA